MQGVGEQLAGEGVESGVEQSHAFEAGGVVDAAVGVRPGGVAGVVVVVAVGVGAVAAVLVDQEPQLVAQGVQGPVGQGGLDQVVLQGDDRLGLGAGAASGDGEQVGQPQVAGGEAFAEQWQGVQPSGGEGQVAGLAEGEIGPVGKPRGGAGRPVGPVAVAGVEGLHPVERACQVGARAGRLQGQQGIADDRDVLVGPVDRGQGGGGGVQPAERGGQRGVGDRGQGGCQRLCVRDAAGSLLSVGRGVLATGPRIG